jgi:hypothetical protein
MDSAAKPMSCTEFGGMAIFESFCFTVSLPIKLLTHPYQSVKTGMNTGFWANINWLQVWR